MKITNISTNRELFLDDHLIDRTTAKLRMHEPVSKEIVMDFKGDHECGGPTYFQVFLDNDTYRMFYIARPSISDPEGCSARLCYCESRDGIHWEKPNLNIVEYKGSKQNNIVLTRKMLFGEDTSFIEDYCSTLPSSFGIPRKDLAAKLTDAFSNDLDNFTICMDTRPECPQDEKFKAITPLSIQTEAENCNSEHWWTHGYAFIFCSPDGFHWKRMSDRSIMGPGGFDSSNVFFWDELRGHIWAYFRSLHQDVRDHEHWIRDIRCCISGDYINWSNPECIDFGEADDLPLYTSLAQVYKRAPQYFIGLPTRYIERKKWTSAFDYLPDPDLRRERIDTHQSPREGLAITDCAFMFSRNGKKWTRYDEAFLRPGIYRRGSWVYGDCYPSWPLIETKSEIDSIPSELCFYSCERQRVEGESLLRRFTLRLDGFVSLNSGYRASETITKPLTFTGNKLSINFSTSAVGWIKIELQDESGIALPGYSLNDCDEIFGDMIERPVLWNGSSDVSAFSGKPLRIRIVMSDCDLYSFVFEI